MIRLFIFTGNSVSMQALGFYITYAFIWTFTLLPFFIYYGVSDILFLVLFYITGYRKEVVTMNLRNAFPEKGEEELKRIRRRFYRHFCDVMLESIKTMHMSNKANARRFKFRNPELFDSLYEKKKNVILVSGHYGNWEWMVRFPLVLKHANFYLYHPLKNRYFDRMINKIRTKNGCIEVSMADSLRVMLDYQKRGELFLSWFIADQTPPKESQHWTNFLNQDTPVFSGVEKIGRKLNHAIVFVDIHKVKRGRYEAEFTLLHENGADTAEGEITESHVRALEKTIRNKPEYWLWSHRRWKHKRMSEGE